jgi:putative hydrolase of the HAD superfamily
MKEGIKAVVFDVNGVLLLGSGISFHKLVSKKLKVDLETWFDAVDQYWSKFISGELSEKIFLSKLSLALNKSESKIKRVISNSFNKKFKPNKWLFKQLVVLNSLGYKTGILSDQVPISYELFEKKYRLSSKVLVSVWSNKVKSRKPNLEIYNICLEKLNVKASEVLFIDNRSWNLIPAEELGMKTILFKNNLRLKKDRTWRNLFI